MATDSYVQVQPDSSGAKVDTSDITRIDGTIVDRQRMNISDPVDPNSHASVVDESGQGALLTRDEVTVRLLEQIVEQIKELKEYLMGCME